MSLIGGISVWCLVSLCYHSTLTRASGSFVVQSAPGVVRARYGSSVVLPCWLSPQLDAVEMEIRWYRPDKFQTPAIFYQSRKLKDDIQDRVYAGRASLTPGSAQSTGLRQGDISLKLENIDYRDNGTFHCYASGDNSYNSSSATLIVTALGSPPLVSLQVHNNNEVNVSCTSCGWFPKPELLWRTTAEGVSLTPGSLIYQEESNRHFCAKSWIVRSATDLISCSIILSEEEHRDVRLDIGALLLLPKNYSALWLSLFIITLLITAVLIGFAIYFYRKYKAGYILTKTDDETGNIVRMDELKKAPFHIKLDQTNFDMVIVKGNMIRDKGNKISSVEGNYAGFPYESCVFGKDPIKEGCKYWEVGLASAHTPPKRSWLIGVASKVRDSKELKNEDFLMSKGFWFLKSDDDGLSVNTEPKTFLPKTELKRVGVLLDYNEGKLSFYNAKKNVCLCTITSKFPTEGVVPLFNPGKNDPAPLKINLNLPVQNSGTEANNEHHNV